MESKVIMFLILAILGLFLLKESITGFVAIGQSCCFPPNCDEENTCSNLESPSPGRLYVGLLGSLIVISLSLYLIYYLKNH